MELLRYKRLKDPPPINNQQRKPNPWLIGLMVIALGGGMSYWYAARVKTPTIEPETIVDYAPVAVTALGRLEPAGEVIKLSVANAQDSRVNQLLVQKNDRVETRFSATTPYAIIHCWELCADKQYNRYRSQAAMHRLP